MGLVHGTICPRTPLVPTLTVSSFPNHESSVHSRMMATLFRSQPPSLFCTQSQTSQVLATTILHPFQEGIRSQCLVAKTKRSMNQRKTMVCLDQECTTQSTASQFQAL